MAANNDLIIAKYLTILIFYFCKELRYYEFDGEKISANLHEGARVGACAAAANARKNVEGMKLSDIFYLKTARDKKIVVTYMNFRTSKKEALTVLWRGRAGKPQVFSNRSCNADLLASMTHSEMRREVRVHHFQKDNRDFPEFKITLSNKSAPDE